MARYYTATEAVELTQAFLGTVVGSSNRRFPPDVVLNALMEAAHSVLPLLPDAFHDEYTHNVSVNRQYLTSAAGVILLGNDVARFRGFEPHIQGVHVEMYGTTPDRTYQDFVDRKLHLTRTNAGTLLVCLQGNRLLLHPAPTANFLYDVSYIIYTPEPSSMSGSFYVPKVAFELVKVKAAMAGKWGDLRAGEGQAILQTYMALLQTALGIDDKERSAEAAR